MESEHLAEAIILQSIEDLWAKDCKEECIRFFTGEDFRVCAAIAGIHLSDQLRILNMVGSLIKDMHKPAKAKKNTAYRYILPEHSSNRELIRT